MTTSAGDGTPLVAELLALISETLDQLDVLLEHGIWCVPGRGSEAAADLANREVGRGNTPWGDEPIRDVHEIAWMALGAAVEQTRGFRDLMSHRPRTPFALEVLCRAVLDSSSLAYWLLHEGLSARTRVARQLVYRLNGARWMEKALDNLILGPGELRSEYGELKDEVLAAATDLGLQVSMPKMTVDDEGYLGYLARTQELSVHISWIPGVHYQVYSGVVHAELWGLWRGYAQVPREGHRHDRFERVCSPAVMHDATRTLLGPLVIAAARAASYLGAEQILGQIQEWAGALDTELDTLRPPV